MPTGWAGNSFVSELASLFRAYADCSVLEVVALSASMVLPILLLQKPHATSKTREHSQCLERRLVSWREGNIEALLHEGRTIQNHLKKPNKKSNSTTSKQDHTAQTFAKLMFKGDFKAALRLISEQHKGKYLHLDSKVNSDSSNTTPCTVCEALRLKHPPSQLAPANIIYSSADPPTIHPVYSLNRLTLLSFEELQFVPMEQLIPHGWMLVAG